MQGWFQKFRLVYKNLENEPRKLNLVIKSDQLNALVRQNPKATVTEH